MPEAKLKSAKDILPIGIALLIAIGVGLLFVLVHRFTMATVANTSRVPFAELLWSLACLIAGGFIGFLFGIPRFRQNDSQPVIVAGSAPANRAQRVGDYLPNTNLDQISDWLTKIIVGLGLINLGKIPSTLDRASEFVALSMGGKEYKYFAGALIIYFTVLGLLGTYLITRIYLAEVFARNDPGLTPISDEEKHQLLTADLSNPAHPQLKRQEERIAEKILSVPLSQLSSLTDIVAWSKAQFNSKHFANAVDGYRRAVELAPGDVQWRLEYTNALYYLWKTEIDDTKKLKLRAEAENQLSAAYRLVQVTSDPLMRMKMYRAITFHYLYDPPPEGFTKVIKYATEYLNSTDPQKIPSGGLLVNLAAAYGQQYKWLLKQGETDRAVLCEVRNKVLAVAAEALRIDNQNIWLNRLRQLLQRDAPKDPVDNDLEVFENDNKLRTLLNLPKVAEEDDTGKDCPDPEI